MSDQAQGLREWVSKVGKQQGDIIEVIGIEWHPPMEHDFMTATECTESRNRYLKLRTKHD